ncbi:MAG: hypothetical protein A2049_11490 [Elusimicrobia bacterium GWA2_62_23]|nr:MAG: hypothetical protein A2049_11490 [Elusimicrobia bacterium GWA2_62_23]
MSFIKEIAMKIFKICSVSLLFLFPEIGYAKMDSSEVDMKSEHRASSDSLAPLEKARKMSRIKGNRKIDITPIKERDGIASGIVVVYGHSLFPPYKVENVGEKVLINGIQVVPSLLVQRDSKPIEIPEEKKARYLKMIQFEKEISKIYYSQVSYKDRTTLQAEILAFAKKNTLVKDARWGKDMLVLDYKVGGGSMLNLKGTTPDKPWPSRKEETGKAIVEYISKGIKSGCILIDSNGGITPGCGRKDTVNEIMQNANLSKEEKINRLSKWGNFEVAMDIVDNYDHAEWKTNGEQK